jgi:hypothetical protein
MGQDFVARKAAKKQRKKASRDSEGSRRKKRRSRDFDTAAVPGVCCA